VSEEAAHLLEVKGANLFLIYGKHSLSLFHVDIRKKSSVFEVSSDNDQFVVCCLYSQPQLVVLTNNWNMLQFTGISVG